MMVSAVLASSITAITDRRKVRLIITFPCFYKLLATGDPQSISSLIRARLSGLATSWSVWSPCGTCYVAQQQDHARCLSYGKPGSAAYIDCRSSLKNDRVDMKK